MQDCMVRPLSMAVLLLSTSAAQLVPASPTLHLQDWASFVFKKLFIYVFSFFFLAALGLRCCVQAVSSCSKRGLPLQRLPSCKAGLQAHWPRGRCARPEQVWLTALVAAGTWQPPGPGLESVSAAVADAFLISHWGPQEAPGLPSQLRSLISKHLHTRPSPDAVTVPIFGWERLPLGQFNEGKNSAREGTSPKGLKAGILLCRFPSKPWADLQWFSLWLVVSLFFLGGKRSAAVSSLPSASSGGMLLQDLLLQTGWCWLFAALWSATRQASLSFTISPSLLRLVSIDLVMSSNHLFLYHPLLLLPSTLPSIRVFFLMSQLFASGGQSIGASSVPLMNTQGWFPFGLTGLISLPSNGLSSLLQHHSSKASILQCSAFFLVREMCKISHLLNRWCIWALCLANIVTAGLKAAARQESRSSIWCNRDYLILQMMKQRFLMSKNECSDHRGIWKQTATFSEEVGYRHFDLQTVKESRVALQCPDTQQS